MRQRSHWGWGWADRWLDREARRSFGEQAHALLGFAPSALNEPVALDAVQVPKSRFPEHPLISNDPEARIRHTHGRAYWDLLRGFRGDFAGAPEGVALPASETELIELLSWAESKNVAVVPWGGGTNVVRALACQRPWIALDLARLSGVHEVDPISRLARVGGGTLGPDLEASLKTHGLTFRHFPQSFEFSTVGGWIATRAGGHFATLYTHVDELVAGMTLQTPRGRFHSLPRPGSGAGPDPNRFFFGSEGTLGVITEAWLRVRPRPQRLASATLLFSNFTDAVDCARTLAQSGLYPSNCRLLDPTEARLNLVDLEGNTVLIVGFESVAESLEFQMNQALAIAQAFGATCPNGPKFRQAGAKSGDGAGTWKSAFIEAPYLQSLLVSLRILADTFETCCTWTTFPRLHQALTERLGAAMRGLGGAGHLSLRFTHVYPDGPAPYYTMTMPTRPGAELAHWLELKRIAADTLAEHGATITHHHAVGRTHQEHYGREVPEPFAQVLWAAKRSLDPAGILNPGNLLPEPCPAPGNGP